MSGTKFRFRAEHSTAPEDLVTYGFDASGLEGEAWAVAWPRNTEEVSGILRAATEQDFAVTPRGAGTGMTGGAVPVKGGVVLSFEHMKDILELDTDNLNVLVEPGLINGHLQSELERRGYFYPPDPASMNFCTIGGNVAENAGGPRAVKYGVTRDYVMALEAVLPDGRVINTGVKTQKGVVGFDLTRLLVGSEGTLAVVTKIRLRCLPLPEAVSTSLVVFGDLEASGRAVSEITKAGIIPRTLEFMDHDAVGAVEKYKPSGLPTEAAALLLIELDGHPRAIEDEAARVARICEGLGGEVRTAGDDAERQRLWDARRALSPALFHVKPGKFGEDIVVPRNRIPEMLIRLRRLADESGIGIVNFGHAGDGNIHTNIMADRRDADESRLAHDLVGRIFHEVLELGGTISGEHGVGLTKSEFIGLEVPPAELELMKGVKKLFDPRNILNPGKIFP